jgi:hypothetical protein
MKTFLFIILLSGCVSEKENAKSDEYMSYKMLTDGNPRKIHRFKFEDGLECVSSHRGGLDCDWH